MVRYLRSANVKDGTLDLSDVKEMNFTPAEQQIFSIRCGDVLVSEGSGSLATVGASAGWNGELEGTICFQNTLIRLRPRADLIDARFLLWWARAAFASGLLASVASGANIYHLSAERVRALPVSLPSLDEQRRIADFLDAEISRLDGIGRAQHRVRELLLERHEQVVDRLLGVDGGSHFRDGVPLKYVATKISVGIVITPAKWYVDGGGILALRGLNVRPRRIILDETVQLSKEGHGLHIKSSLGAGDIVIVRTGQAGAAAVVPAGLDGCNCIDLVIVRPGPRLFPHYLEYFLNSSYFRRRVAEYSVGTIQSHFNVGAMKQVPVPILPVEEQLEVIQVLDRKSDAVDGVVRKIDHQLDLLAERRQALITAAVTGQFDVTTARSGVVA